MLNRETAERLIGELMLIPGYPRNADAQEASVRQLRRICQDSRRYSPDEMATALIDRAIATIRDWRDCGWPGMEDLFREMFGESAGEEYDITAPKPGDCPYCGVSGVIGRDGRLVRCTCRRGAMVSDEELAQWNAPLPELKCKPVPPPREMPKWLQPNREPQKQLEPITQKDIDKIDREKQFAAELADNPQRSPEETARLIAELERRLGEQK